jgi:hypothetical protein
VYCVAATFIATLSFFILSFGVLTNPALRKEGFRCPQ